MTRYCGRDFSFEELEEIRTLIANNPEFTRAKLSREVCRMFQWLKPDGNLKDMSCRVAMLRMEKDGLICLPEPTYVKKFVKKIKFTTATDPQRMVVCKLNDHRLQDGGFKARRTKPPSESETSERRWL
jgi:hypothetical protein